MPAVIPLDCGCLGCLCCAYGACTATLYLVAQVGDRFGKLSCWRLRVYMAACEDSWGTTSRTCHAVLHAVGVQAPGMDGNAV